MWQDLGFFCLFVLFCFCFWSLHNIPALLRTVDRETTSSNMVRQWDSGLAPRRLATQKEGLPRNMAVQVSGCRKCLRLLLLRKGGKDATCVRCEQVDELFSLVVELREEADRLRTIRECEREINWCSDSP